MSGERITRRDIIKRAAYLTPIILTMPTNFSFASGGSDLKDDKKEDKKDKKDK